MRISVPSAFLGWRGNLREMGVAGWCSYKLDRLLAKASRGRMRLWILCLYLQPVPSRPLLTAQRQTNLRFGIVTAAQFSASDFKRPKAAIDSRFERGSVCVAGWTDKGIAGYLWLHFGRLRERMFACDFEGLPAGRTCWDYDLEIAPQYRLGRTFARLWDETFRVLRKRGIAHTASWIHYANLASRRSHERMGAIQAGWLILLDAFEFKMALASSRPFLRFAGPGERIYVPVQAPLDVSRSKARLGTTGDTGAAASSDCG